MNSPRRRVAAITGALGRAHTEAATTPGSEPRLRIGEAAARAGVSTRTLRYYQELDLLTPAGTTAGGARRYSEADVARVERIRHLRDLVGFDLGEVGTVLAAEDRLAAIRHEWFQGQSIPRQRQLLEEAISINEQLQQAAQAKMSALLSFRAELEERAAAYHERLTELVGVAPAADPARPGLTDPAEAEGEAGVAVAAREAELTNT